MCGCEPDFTCSQCAGTPYDPAYFDTEPLKVTADEWDVLAHVTEWRAGL